MQRYRYVPQLSIDRLRDSSETFGSKVPLVPHGRGMARLRGCSDLGATYPTGVESVQLRLVRERLG